MVYALPKVYRAPGRLLLLLRLWKRITVRSKSREALRAPMGSLGIRCEGCPSTVYATPAIALRQEQQEHVARGQQVGKLRGAMGIVTRGVADGAEKQRATATTGAAESSA